MSASPTMNSLFADQPDDAMAVQLSSAIRQLVSTDVRGSVDREKMQQYAQAIKHELYWRGEQYLIPTFSNGMVTDWTTLSGTPLYNNGEAQGASSYDYVVNDFLGYGNKFCAVLQNPPNTKAQPNVHGNQDYERRASKAQQVSEQIGALWKMGAINRALALSLYKDGTTFLYTPFIANPDKWGYSYEEVMEMRDVEIAPPTLECPQCGNVEPVGNDMPPTACPRCGRPFGPADLREGQTVQIPEVVSRNRYANGAVECHVCNIFTVTAPFYSKDINSADYLYYEYEESKGALMNAYPQLRKVSGMRDSLYVGDSSAGSYGRMARDTASSMSGSTAVPRKNRWLFTRLWLRPSMYEYLSDDKTVTRNGQTLKARDVMHEMYPEGCRIVMVQDEVVSIRPERLERLWAMVKSGLSEYMFADPYCKPFVSAQDLINDMHNIAVQTWERAIPSMGVIASRVDVQNWNKMRAMAAELVPFTDGTDLGSVMHQMPVSKPDPSMGPWIDGFREHMSEVIGVTRAIWGGSQPTETAHQAELNKQQGLQQIEVVWNEMREGHAQARQNAILQMAEHSGGRIPDPYGIGTEVTQVEDIEELLDGGWHIEAADGMPMTWAERRAWMMQILTSTNPQVSQMLGYGSPENIDATQEIMGLVDWTVPHKNAKAKVMATIKKLLQGAPIQQPQPDGTVIPIPSVPVDVYEDDHAFSAMCVKDWAQTEDAMADHEKNPDGYENVIAWMRAHLRLMAPPPPPTGPGGAPPAGGPPKPGGTASPSGPPPQFPKGPVGPAGPPTA